MRTRLIKYFFLIPLILIKAQIAEWNIVGQMPNPVSGGNAVVHNDKIYILGGYSDSLQSNVDWIQSYNPKTNEWKFESQMSIPRSYFAAGVNSKGVYYAGGSEKNISINNKNEYLEFWDFNESNSPSSLLRNPIFSRSYLKGEVDESNFYLIGGLPNSPADFTYSLIFKQSLVSTANEMLDFFVGDSSDILFDNMTAMLNNKIFIIGGFLKGVSQKIISFSNELFYVDSLSSSLLIPRALGQAVAIPERNEIYVIGGQNESNFSLSSVEIINLTNNKIRNKSAPQLNKARNGFMSTLFEGKIFIFGGLDEYGLTISDIEVLDIVTGIEEVPHNKIDAFKLEQNYPNPFNPTTTIQYTIPVGTNNASFLQTQIKVYNILGKEVITLVNKQQAPGKYKVKFDASGLPSGIYFYKLNIGSFSETKSMLLLK